jgi:hypothetical protein
VLFHPVASLIVSIAPEEDDSQSTTAKTVTITDLEFWWVSVEPIDLTTIFGVHSGAN